MCIFGKHTVSTQSESFPFQFPCEFPWSWPPGHRERCTVPSPNVLPLGWFRVSVDPSETSWRYYRRVESTTVCSFVVGHSSTPKLLSFGWGKHLRRERTRAATKTAKTMNAQTAVRATQLTSHLHVVLIGHGHWNVPFICKR